MFGVMAMLILTGTHVSMIDFYRCFDVNRSFDGIQTFVPYDRFITLDRDETIPLHISDDGDHDFIAVAAAIGCDPPVRLTGRFVRNHTAA